MANDYFQFKKFTIWQDRCAMKVGTDGTLLGAWARGGKRVLDIGTGTGLVALMMAQRYEEASVVGIDIDPDAAAQAQQNVRQSPFGSRVTILCSDVADYEGGPFDAIVSNPPFFVNALPSPDSQRSLARHAGSMTFRLLMEKVRLWLSDRGECSVIVPFDALSLMETEAALAGLFKVRQCAVSTTPQKPPRRYLLAFRKHPAPIERQSLVIGSDAYQELTKAFYL